VPARVVNAFNSPTLPPVVCSGPQGTDVQIRAAVAFCRRSFGQFLGSFWAVLGQFCRSCGPGPAPAAGSRGPLGPGRPLAVAGSEGRGWMAVVTLVVAAWGDDESVRRWAPSPPPARSSAKEVWLSGEGAG